MNQPSNLETLSEGLVKKINTATNCGAFEHSDCQGKRFKINLENCDRMKAVKEMMLEVLNRKSLPITGSDKPFPLARFDGAISISEENGDILFIDTFDKNSVWLWWHDGADCQKLASDFSTFLKQCVHHKKAIPMATDSKYLDLAAKITGNWEEFDNFGGAYYKFSNEGHLNKYYKAGEISKQSWRVIDGNKIGFLKNGKEGENIYEIDSFIGSCLIIVHKSGRRLELHKIANDYDYSLYEYLNQFIPKEMKAINYGYAWFLIENMEELDNGDIKLYIWRFQAPGKYDEYQYVLRQDGASWKVIEAIELAPMNV